MPDQVELKVNVLTEGADKLEQLVASVQKVEQSLGTAAPALKVTESGIHAVGEAAESEGEKIKRFGESIREHIETPLGSTSASLGKFLETLGPWGAGLAAGAGVAFAFGTAVYESAEKLAQLGTELNNISIRTGLSTQEVGHFSFAAKAAGSDIGSLEMGMKMLSRAMSDSSDEGKAAREEMTKLGIASRDMNGNLRPSSDIFLDLGDALNKADGAFNRNAIAIAVLGRAGLELVPTLMSLRENMQLAQASAEIFTPAQVEQFEDYHKRLLVLSAGWDSVEHSIAEALARAMAYFKVGEVNPEAQSGIIALQSRKEADAAKRAYNALPANAPSAARDAARWLMENTEEEASANQKIYDKTLPGAMDKLVRDRKYQFSIDHYADISDTNDRITADKTRFERGDQGTAKERAESSRKTADEARDNYFALKDVLPDVADAAKTKWLAADAAAKQYEATLKSLTTAAENRKKAEDYISRPQTLGATEFQKIINERNKVAAGVPGTAPDILGYGGSGEKLKVYQRADVDLDAESEKMRDQMDKETAERVKKAHEDNARDHKTQTQKELDEYEETMRPIDQLNSDRRKIAEGANTIDAQSQRSGVMREASRTQKMSELSVPLGSGAAGQEQAINDAYTIRIGLAQKLAEIDEQQGQKAIALGDIVKGNYDIDKARADLNKESLDAQLDKQMKLLELAKQQQEGARTLAGGVFDAMTAKDPGTAMRNFFVGQAKDVGRSVFQNVTQDAFAPISGAMDTLKSAGSHSPEQMSRDKIVASNDRLIAALDNNAQKQRGGGGGGGTAGIGSGYDGAPSADFNSSSFTSITNSLYGGGGGNITGDVPGATYDFSDLGGGVMSAGGGVVGAGGGGGGDLSSMPLNNASPLARSTQMATAQVSAISSAVGTFSASLAKISGGPNSVSGQFGQGAGTIGSGNAVGTIMGSYSPADDGTDPTAARIGAGVGLAGATYAGVTSALHDFKKGGGQGIAEGIGAVAGTAAAWDPEPISHAVLQGIALVSTMVGTIFGDPKAERTAQINHELQNDAYNSSGYIDSHGNYVPGAQNRSISYFGASGGESYDTNFQGGIRGGSFASTTRNMYDPSAGANQLRNGYVGPPAGTWMDQGLGWGDQAGTGPSQRPTTNNGRVIAPVAAPTHIIQVTAMDSKSFIDHASDISDALRKGIQDGHPVVQEMQQAMHPR